MRSWSVKLETRVVSYPAFAVAVLAITAVGMTPAVPVNTMQNPESDLDAVLELAAYFQDDYSKKLPVIAAFRRWRSGSITTTEFLDRLREDDLAAPTARSTPRREGCRPAALDVR